MDRQETRADARDAGTANASLPAESLPGAETPAAALGDAARSLPDASRVGAAVSARPALVPGPASDRETPGASKLDLLAEFFYRPDEGAGELDEASPEKAPAIDAPAEPESEHLAFRLGGEGYALPLRGVREIVKVPPLTEVPRAPSVVAGVMNLRGEILPVFDLRRRMNLKAASPDPVRRARIVVLETPHGLAGLLVDAVEQVVRFRPSSIEAPPAGLGAGGHSEYLAGIGRFRDRLYVLLDLGPLLGFQEDEP